MTEQKKRGLYLVTQIKPSVLDEVEKISSAMQIELTAVCLAEITPLVAEGARQTVLLRDGTALPKPDFVISRAFGMTPEESYRFLTILRMLAGMGVPCINPAGCYEITRDKMLSALVVKEVVPEMRMPKTLLLAEDTSPALLEAEFGYPFVLKEVHGSGGKGVSLVQDKAQLVQELQAFYHAGQTDQLMAQQAVLSSKGRDLRVIVMNGRVIDALVRNNPDDFRSNVHQGGFVEEFEPSEVLKSQVEKIAARLGMKLGSVDFMFGETPDEFYFCEANSGIGLVYLLRTDIRKKNVAPLYLKAMRAILQEC